MIGVKRIWPNIIKTVLSGVLMVFMVASPVVAETPVENENPTEERHLIVHDQADEKISLNDFDNFNTSWFNDSESLRESHFPFVYPRTKLFILYRNLKYCD